jgi:hypothetical protein
MNETVLAHPTYSNVYLNRRVYQLTGNVMAGAIVTAVMMKVVVSVPLGSFGASQMGCVWTTFITAMVFVTALMTAVTS